MPTNAKTKTKRAAQRKSQRTHAAAPGSAISLLKKEHREVEGYFEEYEELEDDNAKAELAEKICLALKVHTQIEEKYFIRRRAGPPRTTTSWTKRWSSTLEPSI